MFTIPTDNTYKMEPDVRFKRDKVTVRDMLHIIVNSKLFKVTSSPGNLI